MRASGGRKLIQFKTLCAKTLVAHYFFQNRGARAFLSSGLFHFLMGEFSISLFAESSQTRFYCLGKIFNS